MRADRELSRRQVLTTAWPIILANAAVPTLGLVDTAVIGHYGDAADLGGLALGALLFNLLYWSFGFLRMGTTGFVAQAAGAGDEVQVQAAFLRACLLAVVLGSAMLVLQWPVATLYLRLMHGSAEVETVTAAYFSARIWGAPAALALYACSGLLIGLGRSRELLLVQLLLNGLNAGLDVWLAGTLGLGARGIGIGTAVAEWLACGVALLVVARVLAARGGRMPPAASTWRAVRDGQALRRAVAVNADILVRTVCLLLAFAWFAHAGARLGDLPLAANHLLLQLVAFSAFFLDGFAFVAEAQVGAAWGARDLARLRRAVRITSEPALLCAALLAAVLWLQGGAIVAALSAVPEVRATAAPYLPWAALYVLVSVAAFQLDGVFIGATRSREMRDAALRSLAVFLLVSWVLVARWGNHGLWAAFVVYVLARALALWPHWRRMQRALGDGAPLPP